MKNAKEMYNSLKSAREAQLSQEQTRLRWFVFMRLLMFAVMVIGCYLAIKYANEYWFGVIASAVVFLVAVRISVSLEDQVKRSKSFVAACLNEQQLLNGDLSGQYDGGTLPSNHNWGADLDVVGASSLFAFLNRANSISGRKCMKERLLDAPETASTMSEVHEAIRELKEVYKERLELAAATTMLTDDEELETRLKDWATSAPLMNTSKVLSVLLVFVPIYSIAVMVLGYFGVLSNSIAFLLFMLPLGIVGTRMKAVQEIYAALGKNDGYFRQYEEVIQTAKKMPGNSLRLKKIQENIVEAEAAMKSLNRILSAFDQRNNLLIGVFSNAIYLADIRNSLRAVDWQKKYGNQLEGWLLAIGELEFYSSLATVYSGFENDLCFPFPSETPVFQGDQLVHPLMVHKTGVANDVSLLNPTKVMLVTGANMAGKSTYLRTVGSAILLSRIGAPVFAKTFAIGDFHLYTSMRTTDSLDSGTSYFMAELKRLSGLINLASEKTKVVALLDEILKGTNSVDKEQGSRGFVEQLVQKDISAIVATHDVSLCTLKDELSDAIDNKHFASEIRQNDLLFDYTLKEGVCDTMNATWLMRSMGIIPQAK